MYKPLASALVGLQATDGFLTMWAVKRGFVEQNALMAPIADTWMLPALKIGMALLLVTAFLPLVRNRKYGKVVLGGLAAGVALLGTVVGLNILEVIQGPFA